jgi:hypothetical protein
LLPKTLTLLATYQCTAACDQCCFGCHPGKHGRIPQERILSYIDQAAALGSVVNVVFSGGECFLLGRDLEEAVARAESHGLLTRCVTNGYWALSEDAARRRLEPLVAAGLKELNLSTGDFHLEYVPVERIRHGALAAYQLGLGLAIMVETRKERSFTKEVLLDDPLFAEIYRRDPEGLCIQENVWIPMQSDCTIAHDPVHYRNASNPHLMRGCHNVLRNMVITPREDYVVCCGLTMDQIPELHIADAASEPLAAIAARADHDLLRRWIRLEGPERIIEFLQQKDPSLAYPWDRVHPCEACRDLHHREDLRQAVRSHAAEVAGDILLRYQLLDEAEGLLSELGAELDEVGMADGLTTKAVLRAGPRAGEPAATPSAVPTPAASGTIVPLSALARGAR